MEIINATDGYKLGHHRMYPKVLNKFIVTGLLEVINTSQKQPKVSSIWYSIPNQRISH